MSDPSGESARTLTAEERELAARSALVAAPRFEHFGWRWGWRDQSHDPGAEEIAAAIESLLRSSSEGPISSGRLMVMRDDSGDGLYDVEVYLQLGTICGGEVDVDDHLSDSGSYARPTPTSEDATE